MSASIHVRAAFGCVSIDAPMARMRLTPSQARELADRLVESALVAEHRPLTGAEAVAEVTGGAQ